MSAVPIKTQEQENELQSASVGDLRFRKLLPADEWNVLPQAIRQRFSKRLSGGATAIYIGVIDRMITNRLGRALAQACRLIGAPLPIHGDTGVTSIVSVTEDMATGGQIWTRLYARRDGFPQIIQSSKRFEGPTGLEEYIGFGIVMALRPQATPTALRFVSTGYSLLIGRLRVPLPQVFSPGVVMVTHEEIDAASFRFTLKLEHPRFGVLMEQSGVFKEDVAK